MPEFVLKTKNKGKLLFLKDEITKKFQMFSWNDLFHSPESWGGLFIIFAAVGFSIGYYFFGFGDGISFIFLIVAVAILVFGILYALGTRIYPRFVFEGKASNGRIFRKDIKWLVGSFGGVALVLLIERLLPFLN